MSRKPEFISQFKAARRSSVPLIAVRSYDHTAATRRMRLIFNARMQEELPMFGWDCCNGIVGMNKASKTIANSMTAADPITGMPDPLINPISFLQAMKRVPDDTLIFMQNLNRFWQDPQVKQAVWNLRDILKATGGSLVMLVGPGTSLPEGLTDDVLVIDEPLATEAELGSMVDARAKANGITLKPDVREKAIDALIGLAMFPAEQAFEMCLTEDSVDLDMLWERKRQLIEQTKGLTVWRGGERFADLAGGENLKGYLARYIEKKKPRAVLMLDEVQRMFAGHQSDNTGIKQGFIKKFLTWMQDGERDGIILIGPAGTMKSSIAKAVGNEANCPTINMDVSGMQQREVGSSEENLDRGLGIADVIAQDRLLVIATTNNATDLPPEFKRRFRKGTFFCDLPTASAQERIWKLYETKYGVSGERPEHTGWTGAEIKECVEKSMEMEYSLLESGRFIVPVCRSGADVVRKLREEASGRYIDAEKPGIYDATEHAEVPARQERKARRTIDADVMASRGRA